MSLDERSSATRKRALPPGLVSQLPVIGAVLFGVGFVLTVAANWLSWRWLRYAPIGIAVGTLILLLVGMVPIWRVILVWSWERFTTGYAQNERGARERAGTPHDRNRPRRPNDR